jgi:malonyl-CoA/methylmalonyl-CoA synthetase
MNLGDLFAFAFQERRHAIGLEYEAEDARFVSLTFGEIDTRAGRMLHALLRRGVRRGDRICVQLHNGIDFIDIFLASTRLGAILVPINTLYRKREVSHIVRDAQPSLVVAAAADLDVFPRATPLLSSEAIAEEAAQLDPEPIPLRLPGKEPAVIVYTSGTTGKAKGALLTHDNLMANSANLMACWRITSDDRYLAALPLFHVHGLANGLITWLAAGCQMRLLRRFDQRRATADFLSFAPTLFYGVPTIYVRLLETPPATARRIGAQMRLFVSGSAPLPSHVLSDFRSLFGHTILERYGMTETLMLMSNPYYGERRPGSVGFPLPGVAVKLLKEDGTEAGEDEVGEVLARGPSVFPGYWRNDEATARSFVDGWFRTGDLARCSADGYYTLCGRISEVIISGGFNIYPREIEEVLLDQPGVHEAAVVGVPDELRGEVPVAHVVAEPHVDPEALRRACVAELASFKVPRAIYKVDALPRNAMGKVMRQVLRGHR